MRQHLIKFKKIKKISNFSRSFFKIFHNIIYNIITLLLNKKNLKSINIVKQDFSPRSFWELNIKKLIF